MYLPRSKYKIKHTVNDLLEDIQGNVYRGPYIELYNGRLFKGSNPTILDSELFNRTFETESKKFEVDRPYQTYRTPSDKEYEQGYYTRYLLRDKRNGLIYETDKKLYLKFKDKLHIQSAKIIWYLTGIVDSQIDGIRTLNVGEINHKTVLSLKKQLPGIDSFLNNPFEFVK